MDQNKLVLEGYKDPDDYDEFLSVKTLRAKLLCRVAWGFKDFTHVYKLLDKVQNDFSGSILEVPVGSGLFVHDKYSYLKKAQITCVDYSPYMLKKAEKVFREVNVQNVDFVEADVANMPFYDNSFDVIFSINGLHVFPDKKSAMKEIARVLKPGGVFIGCSYVREERWLTDKFIDGFFVPKKLFTPPFYNKQDFYDLLTDNFSNVDLKMVKSVACYHCVK